MRCHPPQPLARACACRQALQRPLRPARCARRRAHRQCTGSVSAARTTANATRTERDGPSVRWSEGWGSAETAAAAVGGARGGCEACTHAPVRFLALGAHLTRAAAAGGGEVADGGNIGGGDRREVDRRGAVVGRSRAVLGRTAHAYRHTGARQNRADGRGEGRVRALWAHLRVLRGRPPARPTPPGGDTNTVTERPHTERPTGRSSALTHC